MVIWLHGIHESNITGWHCIMHICIRNWIFLFIQILRYCIEFIILHDDEIILRFLCEKCPDRVFQDIDLLISALCYLSCLIRVVCTSNKHIINCGVFSMLTNILVKLFHYITAAAIFISIYEYMLHFINNTNFAATTRMLMKIW